jgi:hypothetical protein
MQASVKKFEAFRKVQSNIREEIELNTFLKLIMKLEGHGLYSPVEPHGRVSSLEAGREGAESRESLRIGPGRKVFPS